MCRAITRIVDPNQWNAPSLLDCSNTNQLSMCSPNALVSHQVTQLKRIFRSGLKSLNTLFSAIYCENLHSM